MKALTVKNPYAFLICTPSQDKYRTGIKDIENRTWRTHFRGRVFIHASAKIVDVEFTTSQTADLYLNNIWQPGVGFSTEMKVVSAIIGEVDIVDCVVNHSSVWAEKDSKINNGDLEAKTIWNWVLANPVLYDKPILNVKGQLSFWEPKIDIVKCIGCDQKFDFATMEEDDGGENFCSECWAELSPIMAQEAEENNLLNFQNDKI